VQKPGDRKRNPATDPDDRIENVTMESLPVVALKDYQNRNPLQGGIESQLYMEK